MTIPRKMVSFRTGGSFNNTASGAKVITEVPANKILVIETISADIRVQATAPIPEVARLVIVPGYASLPGAPLIDIPVIRLAKSAGDNLVHYVALASMRAYATDGIVQYTIELSKPSSGAFDVSLFGYLIPTSSPSLAP